MSYITAIGTANPTNRFSQPTIAEFMVKAMNLGIADARKLRVLFNATGIETRHSVLRDYGLNSNFSFYSNGPHLDPFPTTADRLLVFREHALTLSCEAIQKCLGSTKPQAITHLIVVSCTGMYAPGLDVELVKQLQLPSNTERTCINFMGCYAAFNAIKLGHAFCSERANAKVLIVCTELCSLHFQREPTEDNLLANALFGDGAAALLMENEPRHGVNLKPTAFYCDLLFDDGKDMAWKIGDVGFEMKLSSYIPKAIQQGIQQLTSHLLQKISCVPADIDYYAIHPGGKKILEVIEHELGLTKANTRHSYEVLRKFGNMSSPTVVFVLNELLQTMTDSDQGKKILSFAFGPGLTLESMVLTVETA